MRTNLLSRLALWLLVVASGLCVGCEEDYDKQIYDLNQRIDQLAQKQVASVKDQVKSLETTALNLSKADDALTKRIDNLKQQAENIDKVLGEMRNAQSTEAKELAETLDEVRKALADHITAYDAVRKDLQNRIKVLEDALADYAKADDLKALNDDLDAWKKVIKDTYATLEQVALLDGRVQALEQNLSQLMNELKTQTESIGQISADLKQAIADFKSADAALQQQMNADKKELQTAIETAKAEAIKSAGEACEAAFETRFDAAFKVAFGDAVSGAFGTAFDKAFAPAFDAAFKAAFGDAFAKEWAPIKEKMMQDFADYDTALRQAVTQAILEEHGRITTEIAEAIAAAVAELESRIKALEDALSALTQRVEALEHRIRSMSWMPQNIGQMERKSILFRGADYFQIRNGKPIVLNNVMDGAHNAVLQYRIEPHHIAEQITARNIEFLVDELPTRADVPQFTITEVSGSQDGILTIKIHTDYVFPPVIGDHVFRLAVRIDLDPANPQSNLTFVSDYVGVVWSDGVNVRTKLHKATLNANGTYDLDTPEYFQMSVRDLETELTLFSNFAVLFQDDLTGAYYKVEDAWGDSFTWGITNLDMYAESIYDGSAFTFNTDISRENLPVFRLNRVDDTLAGKKLTVLVDLFLDMRDAYTGEVYRFNFGEVGADISFVGYDRPLTISDDAFPVSTETLILFYGLFSGELPAEMARDMYQFGYSMLGCNIDLPHVNAWQKGYNLRLSKEDGTVIPETAYSFFDCAGNSFLSGHYDPYSVPATIPMMFTLKLKEPLFAEPGVYFVDVLFTHPDFTWSRGRMKLTITEP